MATTNVYQFFTVLRKTVECLSYCKTLFCPNICRITSKLSVNVKKKFAFCNTFVFCILKRKSNCDDGFHWSWCRDYCWVCYFRSIFSCFQSWEARKTQTRDQAEVWWSKCHRQGKALWLLDSAICMDHICTIEHLQGSDIFYIFSHGTFKLAFCHSLHILPKRKDNIMHCCE